MWWKAGRYSNAATPGDSALNQARAEFSENKQCWADTHALPLRGWVSFEASKTKVQITYFNYYKQLYFEWLVGNMSILNLIQ